jgi:hypothetical protein
MARRKKVVSEEDETKNLPEELEQKQELADEITSDFLGEKVEGGKVVEEEKKEEETKEKPEEEVKTEPEEEKKPEEEVEDIPLDKLKEEIKKEVTKETADKITQVLTGEKEATKEQKDRYQEIADEFYQKHGRNPTWFELIPYIREDVKSEIKREEEEAKKRAEEEKKQREEQTKQQIDAFNKFVDAELKELVDEKKLPNVFNDKDQEAKMARRAIFQTMYEVNQQLREAGQPPITSIYKIYHKYNDKYNKILANLRQPAGANAPVMAGSGATTDETGEYSYEEIHKPKSFVDLFLSSKK